MADSPLARMLAGDNYLSRSASGLKRGASALADFMTRGASAGVDDMEAALSGVRTRPGAILTDAGYVMPGADGQPDWTQPGQERESDLARYLTLFGGAMSPARGAGIAAKSGAGGKAAVAAANALPMDEASRMARASEMSYIGDAMQDGVPMKQYRRASPDEFSSASRKIGDVSRGDVQNVPLGRIVFGQSDILPDHISKYINAPDTISASPLYGMQSGGDVILLDGHHRAEAARQIGLEFLPVEVLRGLQNK